MTDPNVDFENLEISFSCASSYPYAREDRKTKRYFIERLLITPDSLDMTRLNGGASVLRNHDTDVVLGKVVRAWIEDGVLCVRIRFRSDGMSRSLFDDLANGTIPNVSIGYSVEHYNEYTDSNGNLVRNVDKWTAYEVSVCVGIPADPTVGFYRSFDETELQQINITNQKGGQNPMEKRADAEAEMTAEEMKKRIDELEAENAELKAKRAEETETETETTDTAETEEKKSCGGENNEEMRSMMKEISDNLKSFAMPHIQTTKRHYDMSAALASCLTGKGAEYEREISADLYKRSGLSEGANSIMIPFNGDALRGIMNTRELSDSVGSGAGLVSQENMPNMFVDFVRSRIGVKDATFLTGLTGAPVTIPAQTSDTTVAWVSGSSVTTDTNAAVEETTPVIGDVTLTPHKLGGFTTVGKDMILMGNPDATAITMRSLLANVAHKLGTTMLKGNVSPEITGVATATGVQTKVIATMASATWANFTDMIGKVEGLEWDGEQSFVMSASDNALLKSIAKGNYGSGFIVEDGYLDGRRVYVDGSLSSGDIFLGDFSNVVVGQWGGIELFVDPYTLATAGSVRVIVSLVCDIGILRPNTFVMRTAS